MGPGTQLNWLADWIALPGPFERVLREAYSPGDLVVALGIRRGGAACDANQA